MKKFAVRLWGKLPRFVRKALRGVFLALPKGLQMRLARPSYWRFGLLVSDYYRRHPLLARPYREELKILRRLYRRDPNDPALYEDSPMLVFPYAFCGAYRAMDIPVLRGENGLPYVTHQGKRLYFPASWSEDALRAWYRSLCVEQDPESPHRYLTPELQDARFEVFIDAGSAEGLLALEMADRVERVVLIECDPLWLPALRATFAPWKDKVTIIEKKLSDTDSEDSVTLNTLAREMKIKNALLKMDIEGFEARAIAGAGALGEYASAVLCCAYHRAGDARELPAALARLGYRCGFSRGYMLFAHPPAWLPKPEPPYFRKGLIRALK
ncbi:MAG: hypothetical protein FWH26_07270 [Oscillospiraceae bacterium]|nr:hypothetical protein [Oscillospiraceae bacterium]